MDEGPQAREGRRQLVLASHQAREEGQGRSARSLHRRRPNEEAEGVGDAAKGLAALVRGEGLLQEDPLGAELRHGPRRARRDSFKCGRRGRREAVLQGRESERPARVERPAARGPAQAA